MVTLGQRSNLQSVNSVVYKVYKEKKAGISGMALVNHWSYDLIKEMARRKCSNADLEGLKELFSEEIGSKRKTDLIKSIDDLIKYLESNDQISEENVLPLRTVANQCGNAELDLAIDKYTAAESTRPGVNQYQEIRLSEELQRRMHLGSSVPAVAPNLSNGNQNYVTPAIMTDKKRAAIYKKLCKELGRSWRDFGRNLGVVEGDLNEIETRFPLDLKSRILRLLELVEEDECNDPKQLLLIMCRALADCGRKDLRRHVENIMSH